MKNITIIMGGPGSGKGTIANLLMHGRKFNYIETGALFRSLGDNHEIAKIMKSGGLIPDTLVLPLIKDRMRGLRDIMLDGFPRDLNQARWLVTNFHAHIEVIFLNIPHSVMIKRVHNRISEGSDRADDAKDQIVLRRIDTFEKLTMPAIEFLRDAPGIEFIEIDGTHTPERIVGLIAKAQTLS